MDLDELLNIQIYSSTFGDTDLLRVAASTNVVREDFWNKAAYRRPLLHTPLVSGLFVYDATNGISSPALRGFGGIGSGQGFSWVIDGLPQNVFSQGSNATMSAMPMGLFEQVEVVKGPSSALHGNYAFQGTFNFRTWSPSEETHEAVLTAGNHNFARLQLRSHREWIGEFYSTVAAVLERQGDVGVRHSVPKSARVVSQPRQFDRLGVLAKMGYGKWVELSLIFSESNNDGWPGTSHQALPDGGLTDRSQRSVIARSDVAFELPLDIDFKLSASTHVLTWRYGYDLSLPPAPVYFLRTKEDSSTVKLRLQKSYDSIPLEWVFSYNFDHQRNLRSRSGVTGGDIELRTTRPFERRDQMKGSDVRCTARPFTPLSICLPTGFG